MQQPPDSDSNSNLHRTTQKPQAQGLGMDRRSWSFLALGGLVGGLGSSVVFSLLGRNQQRSGVRSRPQNTGEEAGLAGRNLKLAHALDEKHPVHLAMVRFGEVLATRSRGALSVTLFPNGQLGSETDTIEQLQRGVLALAKSSAAPLESFVPTMALFGLPYLFSSREHFFQVLDGEVGEEVLLSGIKVGLRGMCFLDAGSRSFYTKDSPVLSPADLAGRKIRVMRSKTAMDMVSAMGGAPTPMPFGELYTALQQGMVDGAENNPPSYFGSRHFEVAKHYCLDEHARIPDVLLFSEKIWQTLNREERTWIRDSAAEASIFQRNLWQEETRKALAELEERGVTVHRPSQDAFRSRVQPLYDRLPGNLKSLVRRVRERP